MLLCQIFAYIIIERVKKSHIKIINLKHQLQYGIKKFELSNESYSVSDIQDYFE